MRRFEGFQRGVNLGGWLSQLMLQSPIPHLLRSPNRNLSPNPLRNPSP